MKKVCRSLLCAVIVFCLLTGFAPLTAQAKDTYHTTVHTLKQKSWVTVKGIGDSSQYEAVYHVYKMEVPSGGYVRIYLNTNKAESTKIRPALYKGVHQNTIYFDNDQVVTLPGSGATTTYLSLEKGTYYFFAVKDTKVKWDFQKVSRLNNYCKAKAYTQAAGKNKVLYFDYGYAHAQWFKVTLSKKQKVAAYIRNIDGGFTPDMLILDSRCRAVKAARREGPNGDFTLRTDLLNKGTYYIRVSRSYDYFWDYSDTLDGGRILSFTWKKY